MIRAASHLWNRSFFVQTSIMICAGFVVAQVVIFLIFCGIQSDVLREAAKAGFARELMLAAGKLDGPHVSASKAWSVAATEDEERYFWVSELRPRVLPDETPSSITARLQRPLTVFETLITPAFAEVVVDDAQLAGSFRDVSAPAGPVNLTLHESRLAYLATTRLPSGLYLNGVFPMPSWTNPLLVQSWGTMTLTMLTMMAISIPLSRRFTRPMRKLAAAAHGFGQGHSHPVELTGPYEAQRAADAFNRMQEQISRLLEDRTHMLSAIGHDLRTPLTSARLRAHLIEDDEEREGLLRNLDGIDEICESALSLVRDLQEEPVQRLDLSAFAAAVCGDMMELGKPIAFDGGPPVVAGVRPIMLRRALVNLIENAVAYGRVAEVRVEATEAGARLIVSDRGPGIPAGRIDEMFEPFRRLETSRSRSTGGAGLGLSLVRSIARRHGGDVTLTNRSDGSGLNAVIWLPA